MSLQKNYYDITEEAAIKLSIELGESGSEFNSASWKSRGSLKPDNTLTSFEKKLKRYFAVVVISGGKGKKRRYSLQGLRDEPLARIDNRNGRKMEEEVILLPYVIKKLNDLASDGKYETTINELAKKVFFLSEIREKKGTFVNELFSVLENTDVPKSKIRGIASRLWESYELNIVTTLKSLLDTLEKQEFISQTQVYKARYVSEGEVKDYDYYTLNPLEVDELKELEAQTLQSLGMDYKTYQKYFVLSQVPDGVLDIRGKVSEAVKEELNIERYYKAIKIEILDNNILTEPLSESEIAEVCLKRFSRLTTQKAKKTSYQKGLSYDKKFHYLAHLFFMKVMNPLGNYGASIEKELKWVDKKVNYLKEHYRQIYAENRLMRDFEPSEYDLIVSDYYAELAEQGEDIELGSVHLPKPLGFGYTEEMLVPLLGI